ncbi:hypothetical protein Lser_V15G40495 [Lactuca serriola]
MSSRNYLAISGHWKCVPGITTFVNVYGPQSTTDKRALWSELITLKNGHSGTRVFLGDFNAVRFEHERFNYVFCKATAIDFNRFITEADLHEFNMGGSKFTYLRDDGFKLSKIDRFLVCSNFISIQPLSSVIALARDHSDHSPLILKPSNYNFGPIPFRFFNSWLLKDDFNVMFKNTWESFCGFGAPDRFLAAKLKILKNAIRDWTKVKSNTEHSILIQLKTKVEKLESIAEFRLLTEVERISWRDDKKKIMELERLKKLDMQQMAKIKWATDGDENTRFFHGTLKQKSRKNRIHGLNINGEWISDPIVIKSKAPGTDGYTFKILKANWDVISGDIIRFVKYFESTGSIAPGCNSSSITLIPKVNDPLSLGDYRPISLIGCMYKVVANLLANRLKQVIDSVVDKVQSAYIQNRFILDGPLIINELLSWAKQQKKKIFLFKIDFEKAFDSINWGYLDSVMDQMNFGRKWTRWITCCLSSSKASVLVNGAPTTEFPISKRVRQGDPLSRFLFILAMEGLNIAIRSACEKALFHGVKLPRDGPSVSHLFYADDAIFFEEWNIYSIKNLSRILKSFHISSGLKVNFFKSRIFGVGVSKTELSKTAQVLDCLQGDFPFTYLGVPVGADMALKKNWKPILDKFSSKLSSWKAKSLSFGGRLTLIKSVLDCLPTYYMSLFKDPQGIIDQLDKIRRRFLLGEGGLGVGSLLAQNIALLIKWWWRFMNDKGSFWKEVIMSIHNLYNKPAIYIARKTTNGIWCDISKAVKSIEKLHIDHKDIFALTPETVKNCRLEDRFSGIGFSWMWRHEPTSDIELKELLELYLDIGNMTIEKNSKYGFRFILNPTGEYIVKIMRKLLESKLIPFKGPAIWWSKLIPLKVSGFIWRAVLGRIPVADTLATRGIIIPNNLCPLCNKETETVDHILVTCEYSREVQYWILKWCGIEKSGFKNVKEFTDYAATWGICPRKKLILNMVFHCLI